MTQRVVVLVAVTFTLTFSWLQFVPYQHRRLPLAGSSFRARETTPGRPTLKRRGKPPRKPPQKTQQTPALKLRSVSLRIPRSVAADQPVTLNFEGLIGTDEAELRKYIKRSTGQSHPSVGSKHLLRYHFATH